MLKTMFNGREEGKARMEGGGHDKEVASSEFNTNIQKSIPYLLLKWRQNGQNRCPIYEKPYPLGLHIPILPM